jgi:hypothetical protein
MAESSRLRSYREQHESAGFAEVTDSHGTVRGGRSRVGE